MKSAAIKNKSIPPWATFSNGLWEGALEFGEGCVLLEGTSDGFATIWADCIAKKAAERRKECKSAAIMNKSLPPWATFSNGLRGGSLETGEGVVALEALAEPNGTFNADHVFLKAAETRET